MTIQSLPRSCLNVIDNYWRLKAAEGVFVRCPYFRNPQSGREKWGLTVYGGKGSPQDIETELRIIEKLENADFSRMRADEIRDIMKKRKLGIECSGFIAQVLDAYTRKRCAKPLHRLINFNRTGIGWLFCKMRPYTHIDVETLVNQGNAQEIYNIQKIIPGDLIRFNTQIDHAAIITTVERDDSDLIKKIFYAHSVLEDKREGIKNGTIDFVNPDADLLSQKWQEEPNTGNTIDQRGVPKIYRLHILNCKNM